MCVADSPPKTIFTYAKQHKHFATRGNRRGIRASFELLTVGFAIRLPERLMELGALHVAIRVTSVASAMRVARATAWRSTALARELRRLRRVVEWSQREAQTISAWITRADADL